MHQWIRVPVGNSNTLTIELWRNASPLHLRFKASLEGVAQLNLSDLIPGELTPTPLTFERVAQESTGGGISSAGDGREEGGGERDEEAGEVINL